jgi:hypothetical protein
MLQGQKHFKDLFQNYKNCRDFLKGQKQYGNLLQGYKHRKNISQDSQNS